MQPTPRPVEELNCFPCFSVIRTSLLFLPGSTLLRYADWLGRFTLPNQLVYQLTRKPNRLNPT